MKKWLYFVEVGKTSKTKIWEIYSLQDDSFLGQIKWYGAWRQYCFFTKDTQECIWNKECLQELSTFIEEQMKARK